METSKPDFQPVDVYRFFSGNCLKEKLPLSGDHHYSSTNIRALNEQCNSPAVVACRQWVYTSVPASRLCCWSLLSVQKHTAFFKCVYLICYSGGRPGSRGPCSQQGKWTLNVLFWFIYLFIAT